MINFFGGGTLHLGSYVRQLGGQCLPLVERLRTDFSSVIDTHEPSNVLALWLIHWHIGHML
jgi:hypothetical protein